MTGLFDGMSDCVHYMHAGGSMHSLFVYCELGLIARLAGSVASAFINGGLNRTSSKKNRNKMVLNLDV